MDALAEQRESDFPPSFGNHGYVISLCTSMDGFHGTPLVPASRGPADFLSAGRLERGRLTAELFRDIASVKCEIVVHCLRVEEQTAEKALAKVMKEWWKQEGEGSVRLVKFREFDEAVKKLIEGDERLKKLTPEDAERIRPNFVMEWGSGCKHHRYT